MGVEAWWKRGDRVRHKKTKALGTVGGYSASTGHADGRTTVSGIVEVTWTEKVGEFRRGYYAQDLLESA